MKVKTRLALLIVVALITTTVYDGQKISVMAAGEKSQINNMFEEKSAEGQYGEKESIELAEGSSRQETGEQETGKPEPEEPTTKEPETEEPTTEEATTVDYEIIDGVYKVKNNVLIEYLREKTDKNTTTIKIPASVIKIDSSVFEGCKYIEKVTFVGDKKLTEIGNYAFKNCEGLKTVSLPSSVKKIGKHAFYGCKKMQKFTIPSGVTEIKKSTFYNCASLNKVSMSKNVKLIEKYAFKKCTSLTSLTIYKKTTSIGADVFDGDKKLVLKVYANSTGKAYARKNKIKWEYTDSEIQRRAANQKIYNQYMKKIKSADKKKFQLKKLKDYVPQGTCIVGKYLIVSMYYKNLKKNSILLLYNKSTGAYVKKVVLPSKDHVGSVTNVKGRLVVALNNISSKDYVAVISEKKLKKIKSGKKIKYDYKKKLSGHADFASFDGTYFWAGRSANTSSATMQGYRVKVKKKKLVFTKKYSYYVPANTQGMAPIKTSKNKRKFIFSQSYGRINNSSLITYSVNLKKAKSLGNPQSTKTLPSMLEGITITSKGYLYMVFESGCGLYCSNPDNTSEIQINNVCRVKYSKL